MSTEQRREGSTESSIRRADADKAEYQGRIDQALRIARVVTWEWRSDDRSLKFLSATAGLLRVELKDQSQRPDDFAIWVHPDDVARVVSALDRCCSIGRVSVDFRAAQPRDGLRWMRLVGEKPDVQAGADDRDEPICLGVLLDLSDTVDDVETRSRLAAIVESSEDAIVSKTLDGIITSWNAGAERLFGYTADEVVGRSIMLIVPENRRAEERYLLRRLQTGERIEHFETRRLTKDGRVLDISLSVSPVRDAAGRIVGASKIARDITDHKRSQAAILENERRMRTLTEGVKALVGALDREYRFRYASSGYSDWFGIAPERIVGMHASELVGNEVFESRTKLMIDRALAGETVRFEGIVPYTRGGPRYIAATIMPECDAHGEIIGVYQFVQDLTERNTEKEALRLSEERYRSLVMLYASVVWKTTADGRMTDPNPQWEAYTGQHWPEYAGDDWMQVLHPEDRQSVRRAWRDSIASGAFFQSEGRIWQALSQSYRFFEAAAVPVRNTQGAVIEWVGTLIDIHDRKSAETAASLSEQRFRHLANNISQLAWEADGSGWVYWFNERWYNYTGRTRDKLEGWGWQQVVHPDQVTRVLAAARENLSRGKPWTETYAVRGIDGNYRWFLMHMNPMRDAFGTVIRWLGTHTDVTDHMELEQALKEADRRKDEFIAMLGHELRNPLSAIVNGARVITRLAGISGNDKIRDMCSIVNRQSSHMARLVNDLLDVSRITRGKLRLTKDTFDVEARIEEIIKDFRTSLVDAALDVKVIAPDRPLYVTTDRERMGQIFGNLLHNSVKFSEDACHVVIELSQDGSDAVISLRDKGIGMDSNTLANIFHTFRQGDEADLVAHDGLGLGLALVKQLVELQGGSVTAHSPGKGQGSEFVIRMPLADAGQPLTQETPLPPSGAQNGPRFSILLVDDSRVVADVFSMILRDMGHDVEVADSGARALQILETSQPQIIISDISMPRMNGYEFARRVRSQNRFDDVMLVATTGLGLPEDRRRALSAGFDEHLVKPPDGDELSAIFDKARQRFVR